MKYFDPTSEAAKIQQEMRVRNHGQREYCDQFTNILSIDKFVKLAEAGYPWHGEYPKDDNKSL